MGYYSMPVHEHPLKDRVRSKANHYVTGRGGGRDIDLRKFAAEGMCLYGRLDSAKGSRLEFQPDLSKNLDGADSVSESIKNTIDGFIASRGIEAPVEARYTPVWRPESEPRALDLMEAGITSVVWSVGFRTDYRFVEIPVFDGKGYPVHERGVTTVSGLFFLGLPWLYTWGSGRFSGVAADAEYIAERVLSRIEPAKAASDRSLNVLALGS
jgi:putative flavoprotein involved in K+ transport